MPRKKATAAETAASETSKVANNASEMKPKTTRSRKKEPEVRVLFASSEVAPFAASGGLADVAGSLPVYLNRSSCDVRVILPLYGSISKASGQDEVRHLLLCLTQLEKRILRYLRAEGQRRDLLLHRQ
ncbi:MAG: glycogen/starch synthase [Oscillospiraceae bacterium]|nr:glycogen/starch synthase [Oscillospiraceae bacterium]